MVIDVFNLESHGSNYRRPVSHSLASPGLYSTLKELDILAYRPTRRGTRAGRACFDKKLLNKRKHISSLCLMNTRSVRNKANFLNNLYQDP